MSIWVHERRMDIELVLQELEAVTHDFVRSHEAFHHRKENLEAGRLTENILSPEVLELILGNSEDGSARMVSPLQWYYENTVVVLMWFDHRLVYRTKLPLVKLTEWHHITIRRWPLPVGNWQATIQLPMVVLKDTRTGALDVSPSCYGRQPRVCRHGLITHVTTQGCLPGLLTADPSYDQECAWLFEPRIPRDAVYPQTTNVYTLSTNGTDLVYRCEGQLESRTTVTAGVYELTITSPCTLYGRDWYLTSTFQRTINVSLQTEEVNFTLNTTLSNLFSEDSNFEPLVNELELMDDVERKQLTFSDIEASMLKNGPTLFSKRWHGFGAVPGLAILAGVAVGLWHRLRRTLAPPGEDKIEIDIRPVCESKPAARPTDPFTFSKH